MCTPSDYEASTGFGCDHLACFVADAERYHVIATSDSNYERRWGMRRYDLRYRWVAVVPSSLALLGAVRSGWRILSTAVRRRGRTPAPLG